MQIQRWPDMGQRERAFAALQALLNGESIQYAIDSATYNPRTDRVYFGGGRKYKVAGWSVQAFVGEIRSIFPALFTSDQAVLNAIAIEGEPKCELGCGQPPHPGYACGDR